MRQAKWSGRTVGVRGLAYWALAAALVLGLTLGSALAAGSGPQESAEQLYCMGLLDGSGTLADGTPDFNLSGQMTRGEAVTMVVRLTGGKEEALSGAYQHPFTDVAGWGEGYVGYAYAAGIANGVGGDSFGFQRTITQAEYLTMLLRAMGYSGVDWRDPYATAGQLGLTAGTDYYLNPTFSRGDMAVLSYSMMDVEVSGTGVSLYDTLEALGALDWRELPGSEPEPEPEPTITPGPVYSLESNRVAVNSKEEMILQIAATMDARMSYLYLEVPRGEEATYRGYLLDSLECFPDADGLSLSTTPNGGLLSIGITYRDGVRVMAYMEGKLASISEQDMALYEEAVRVHDSLVDPSMSEYERVKAFHDYLCKTVTYKDNGDVSHTAYGALVKHASVCQGYTQAMDLLCYLSGIDCEHIFGQSTNGGERVNHSWVRVNIDGGWYNVDPTWDDQVSYISYKYFLVSDAHMSNHIWTDYPNWPTCPSDYEE